jgi:hypothetical protein
MHLIDPVHPSTATVTLECYQGLTWPAASLTQCSASKNSRQLSEFVKLETYCINLLLPKIEIIFPYKAQEETVIDDQGQILRDQRVSIRSIFIDDISLDMHLVRDLSEYIPQYRHDFLEYCVLQGIGIDSGPSRTLDLFHAGTWQLTWAGSFWPWYQQQRRGRQKSYHDIKKFQNMIGDDNEQVNHDLKRFRQKYFNDI